LSTAKRRKIKQISRRPGTSKPQSVFHYRFFVSS
jgi:hypothetical protein